MLNAEQPIDFSVKWLFVPYKISKCLKMLWNFPGPKRISSNFVFSSTNRKGFQFRMIPKQKKASIFENLEPEADWLHTWPVNEWLFRSFFELKKCEKYDQQLQMSDINLTNQETTATLFPDLFHHWQFWTVDVSDTVWSVLKHWAVS